MGTVHQFMRRIKEPAWMPDPDSWTWTGPDGRPQGFGDCWRDDPGQANLLWLALGLDRPPQVYNARANPLYMLVLLGGKSLSTTAAMFTLEEYSKREAVGLERQLVHMAQRRLHVLH
jgi:hypothetical protein